RILNGAIYLGLIYLLVDSSGDVTMVPILYTIGVTTAVVTLGTFSLIDKPFSLPSRGYSIYIELFKKSSAVGFGGFFANIVQLLPPILIGIFLSLSEAGVYGAAFRIIIIAMMLDRIFVNLLLPNLSSLWASNKSIAIQRVNMVLRLIVVGGCVLAFLTAVNAPQIILLLYGTEFVDSIPILQILSGFILLTFLNSLFSFGLIATNNDKRYFLATCIGGTISAVIIVLFSVFGTSAYVATSVLIAECILTLSSYWWFRKVIPTDILKPLLIIVPASVLLFFVVNTFDVHYLIASLIGIILIPLLSWYSRIIKIGELNWAREKILK
ncbi:MAG: polysaccharide biosynthesis C-terminal domain-containing protein, partial [Balneola sp.]